jgi:uncharacterized protein YuzE
MKEFKFDYDEENDNLFVYLDGETSSGAVELGNFVFDFNDKEELVAIEILEATEVLSKLISKIIKLSKIKELKTEIISFRNMKAINFAIRTNDQIETANIVIPRIRNESPSLSY